MWMHSARIQSSNIASNITRLDSGPVHADISSRSTNVVAAAVLIQQQQEYEHSSSRSTRFGDPQNPNGRQKPPEIFDTATFWPPWAAGRWKIQVLRGIEKNPDFLMRSRCENRRLTAGVLTQQQEYKYSSRMHRTRMQSSNIASNITRLDSGPVHPDISSRTTNPIAAY